MHRIKGRVSTNDVLLGVGVRLGLLLGVNTKDVLLTIIMRVKLGTEE